MSIFEQLGRFLEHGSEVLREVSLLVKDSREALAVARPALESMPALVEETRGLVAETREAVRVLSPLARLGVRVLEAEAARIVPPT
jgi:hypothetical protein